VVDTQNADPQVFHGKMPARLSSEIEKVSSQDKTLKMYEGLYHEVHNEPQRETMFKDVEDWLQTHV